ncbi:MAG TPA: hypothetical protein HA257_01305 [Candidatus Methanoperedenaceae archaeon]|nr:hypothetical protein [Candidatus Methanoperedenaceae archaeon]
MAEEAVGQRVVRKRAVREAAVPERMGSYEVMFRQHRGTYQKILWTILSAVFILLGIYAMLGGPNPFL